MSARTGRHGGLRPILVWSISVILVAGAVVVLYKAIERARELGVKYPRWLASKPAMS